MSAQKRGISLPALLDDIADQIEREDALASERAATIADAQRPEATAENAAWDLAVEVGHD